MIVQPTSVVPPSSGEKPKGEPSWKKGIEALFAEVAAAERKQAEAQLRKNERARNSKRNRKQQKAFRQEEAREAAQAASALKEARDKAMRSDVSLMIRVRLVEIDNVDESG